MRSDVLLRGSSNNSRQSKGGELDGSLDTTNSNQHDLGHTFLSSSISSMSSASHSSSSITCSSPAHTSPPSSPSLSTSSIRSSLHVSNQLSDLPNLCGSKSPSPSYGGINFDKVIKPYLRLPTSKFNIFNSGLIENDINLSPSLDDDNMVAHDLSLKKPNNHAPNNTSNSVNSDNLITIKECEEVTENVKKTPVKSKRQLSEKSGGSGHSKRGVLPKQATSIMRSWLFQHIVVSCLTVECSYLTLFIIAIAPISN